MFRHAIKFYGAGFLAAFVTKLKTRIIRQRFFSHSKFNQLVSLYNLCLYLEPSGTFALQPQILRAIWDVSQVIWKGRRRGLTRPTNHAAAAGLISTEDDECTNVPTVFRLTDDRAVVRSGISGFAGESQCIARAHRCLQTQ